MSNKQLFLPVSIDIPLNKKIVKTCKYNQNWKNQSIWWNIGAGFITILTMTTLTLKKTLRPICFQQKRSFKSIFVNLQSIYISKTISVMKERIWVLWWARRTVAETNFNFLLIKTDLRRRWVRIWKSLSIYYHIWWISRNKDMA